MKPHEQRVLDERDALDAKSTALATFITSDRFSTVSALDQYLLERQFIVMQEYQRILDARITLFGE